MAYECNLDANRIGKISKKTFYNFKVAIKGVKDDLTIYQVIGKDGWKWSEATTPLGAVQGAKACGIPVSQIDFNGNFIPLWKI